MGINSFVQDFGAVDGFSTVAHGAGGKAGSSPRTDANTLQSNHVIRLLEAICEGPIKSISAPYLNEVPLYDEGGALNFKGVTYHTRLGLPDQSAIPGFSSQEAEIVVDTHVVKATPVVRTINEQLTDAVRVQIKIPQLWKLNKEKGDMLVTDVSYRVQYQPSGGSWIDISGSPFVLSNQKCTSPTFLAHRFNLTGAGPWNVRVVRETDDAVDSTELANEVHFFSYTQIIDQKFVYPHTALLAISASAEQFGNNIPSRAVLVEGLICPVPVNFDPITRVYTGIWNGAFKEEWTDCPAWCLRAVMRNERWGLGRYIPETYLDDTTLYAISQYCAPLVDNGDGSLEPRFSFNAYISTRFEAYQLLNAMSSVFRGMIYYALGSVMFTADMPRDPEVTVTRANTVDGEFSYKGASLLTVHNRVNVTYNNPANFYKRDVVTVDDREGIFKNGLRPTDIIAFGCTSRAQAVRAGRWLLYTERMESEVITYVAGPDHFDIGPGSVVRVMDPSTMGVSMGGRLSGYTTNTVTLDRSVYLDPGQAYELVIHDKQRALHYRTVTSASGSTAVIDVSVALPELTANPLETIWALRKISGPDTLWRVLANREVGKDQYEITALQHDPSKYGIIEGGYELPSFPEPLMPTGALPVPQNFRVAEFVAPAPGAADSPSVQLAFTRHTDPRVRGYELSYRIRGQEWRTIDLRMNNTVTLPDLVAGARYHAVLRAYDGTGRKSNDTSLLVFDVTGRPADYIMPNVSSPVVVGGIRQIQVKWVNPSDLPSFKEVEIYSSATGVEATAVLAGATPSERFTMVGLGTGETRHFWARTVAHGTPLVRSGLVYVGQATTHAVVNTDVDGRGLNVLDASGDLVFGANGEVGAGAYVWVNGSQIAISQVAANSLVPSINYVGAFSTPPTQGGLGAAWAQNAVYRNTTDGNSYILTGTPLAWSIYFETGFNFTVGIESSNGTSFKVGMGQTTLLSARLFKNGAEVTTITPASWFRWRRVSVVASAPPNDDATFNALYSAGGYKNLSVSIDQINSRATFFCDIVSP
jgi:predicted phage tail protein